MQIKTDTISSFIKYKIELIRNSKFGTRVFSAVFWSMFGAVFQKVLLLLSSFICINILGKEDFGKLGIVRSTIQIFIILGAVGLGSTATKFIAEFRDDKDNSKLVTYYSTIKLLTIFSALIATIVILLSGRRLALYLEDESLTVAIKIGAILLFFSIITSIQTGVLAGLEDFKHIAIVSIAGGMVEFLCIILGSYFWSVNGALIGYGLGFLAITLLNEVFIYKNKTLKTDFFLLNKEDTKRILIFSTPLLGSSLLVTPVLWYVQTMLVKAGSFEDLSVYTAADQWKMVLLFIPSSLSRVILPMLSNVLATDEQGDFKKILMINIKINAITTIIMFIIFLMASPLIIHLYGFTTMEAFPTFALLTGSTLFSCLATVAGQAITSKSKTFIGLLFNLAWGIMIVFLSWLFLKLGMKSTAIALATIISYFLHTVFQMVYLKLTI